MAMNHQHRTLTQPKRIRDPLSNGFTLLIILSLLVFNVLPLLKVLVESFRDSSGSTFSLMGYVRAFQYKHAGGSAVHHFGLPLRLLLLLCEVPHQEAV